MKRPCIGGGAGLGVCDHWAQAGTVGGGGGVAIDSVGGWLPLLG